MSTIGRGTLQSRPENADTGGMHFRRERVRVETTRHEIEGTLQLPNEGFRSRTTDFLNAHGDEFIALTDARVCWLDGTRAPEEHAFLALAAHHVVLVVELESLGVFDEAGGAPAVESFGASAPPPTL
jgi:hypothetical protein